MPSTAPTTSVKKASSAEDVELDLSLLTDGRRAERDKVSTIDVADRYFQTPRRRFIIVDAPGHEQYTRNMATAVDCGSGADPRPCEEGAYFARLGVTR